jgi:hypothetical protein
MWIQSNSIIFVGQNFASVKDNCRSKITISKSLNLCPPYKKEIRGSPEIIDREWEVLAFGRGCSPFPALVLCSAPRPLGFRVARTTRAPCPAHAAYPHTRSYAPPPFPVELELLSRDEGKGREGKGGEGEGEVHRAMKARGRSQSHTTGRCPLATGAITTCATPNLLFKYLDKIFATYVWRQIIHLK